MTSLEAALRQIGADLTRARVSFALVGGLAVSVRTQPRFTRDADLAVALASDAEAEALIHDLRARDYRIEAIVEQEAVGRLATVRLTFSSEPQAPVIDLLFASSGIEPEVAEREAMTLESVKLAAEVGVDINAANADGRTALDAAKASGYDTVVRFLVEKGARPGVNKEDKSSAAKN